MFRGHDIHSLYVRDFLIEVIDSKGEMRGAKPLELRYIEDSTDPVSITNPRVWKLYIDPEGGAPVGFFTGEDALKWALFGAKADITPVDHTMPGLSLPLFLCTGGQEVSWLYLPCMPLTPDGENIDLNKWVEQMKED